MNKGLYNFRVNFSDLSINQHQTQKHWNKVFLLNLVRKLWRTDKSNTFVRVMPPVQLLPQTLPVTSVWPGDRTHDICAALQQPGHFTARLPRWTKFQLGNWPDVLQSQNLPSSCKLQPLSLILQFCEMSMFCFVARIKCLF